MADHLMADLIPRLVYKICRARDWDEARPSGAYDGSADDVRDGFIHLSTGDQLAGTAAKHFRHIDDLVLVAFETAALGDSLAWEPSRGGALFPHLYAPLPVHLALWVRSLPLGPDGVPLVAGDL